MQVYLQTNILCMQLQLPIFPVECKMISSTVGVYESGDIVQYIINGLPVYAHGKDDLQAFRFFTSNLIHQGRCKQIEVERCFCVSSDSVMRNLKKFREQGEQAFFSPANRHGHSHKIRGEVLERIQKKLDNGQSVNSIAKQENLTEGAIRYAIKQKYLKKSPSMNQPLQQDIRGATKPIITVT